MAALDARITPARGDIAAAHLKGKVDAARFVEGRVLSASRGVVSIHATAEDLSRIESQLLFGESFIVYDEKDGKAWGQSAADDYVGYVRSSELAPVHSAATHRVTALATHSYAGADPKTPPLLRLSMNAKVAVVRDVGAYAEVATDGFVPLPHIAPIAERAPDFVAIAEMFAGVPYLWGGRSADGIDCSGLVHMSLERAGVRAPRDSDMQEKALGSAIAFDPKALKRGDLIFWNDHVAIMCDGETILHANSRHMMVAREPLAELLARNAQKGRVVQSVRRL